MRRDQMDLEFVSEMVARGIVHTERLVCLVDELEADARELTRARIERIASA